MTTENLTEEQRENILKARKIILNGQKGFIWNLTKEGSEYWFKVCIALERIANSNKPKKCPRCGQEMK